MLVASMRWLDHLQLQRRLISQLLVDLAITGLLSQPAHLSCGGQYCVWHASHNLHSGGHCM